MLLGIYDHSKQGGTFYFSMFTYQFRDIVQVTRDKLQKIYKSPAIGQLKELQDYKKKKKNLQTTNIFVQASKYIPTKNIIITKRNRLPKDIFF